MIDRTRIGALLLLTFAAAYGWQSLQIPVIEIEGGATGGGLSARSLPMFLTVTAIALACLAFWQGDAHKEPNKDSHTTTKVSWTKMVAFLGLMSLFGMTIRPLGFVPATLLFLLAGFYLMGQRKLTYMISFALAAAVGVWVLLNYGLGVYIDPFPTLANSQAVYLETPIHDCCPQNTIEASFSRNFRCSTA